MWPGLKLQLLTTREPDLSQLAVAIAAMEAVLSVETSAPRPTRTGSAWKSSRSEGSAERPSRMAIGLRDGRSTAWACRGVPSTLADA